MDPSLVVLFGGLTVAAGYLYLSYRGHQDRKKNPHSTAYANENVMGPLRTQHGMSIGSRKALQTPGVGGKYVVKGLNRELFQPSSR